jgi:hypothetical protein
MKRTIEEQIGEELATQRGGYLGVVIFSRPYQNAAESKIQHHGPVADFLMVPKHQSGAWLIEVFQDQVPSLFAVRWNEETTEWENLGLVRYSSL